MIDWAATVPVGFGVLIGAAATFAMERMSWRRTHSVRWDEIRLRAYAEYAEPVAESMGLCSRIAAIRDLDQSQSSRGVHPVDLDEGLRMLAELEACRAKAWQKVLLLGDRRTVVAAREWHQSVWLLIWYARGLKTDQEGWKRSATDSVNKRDEFYAAARHDLAVVRGDLPSQPQWPLPWMVADTDQ